MIIGDIYIKEILRNSRNEFFINKIKIDKSNYDLDYYLNEKINLENTIMYLINEYREESNQRKNAINKLSKLFSIEDEYILQYNSHTSTDFLSFSLNKNKFITEISNILTKQIKRNENKDKLATGYSDNVIKARVEISSFLSQLSGEELMEIKIDEDYIINNVDSKFIAKYTEEDIVSFLKEQHKNFIEDYICYHNEQSYILSNTIKNLGYKE